MDEPNTTTVAAGEAYISGALTALDDAPRTRLFYELLAEIAEASGLRSYLPHRVTDPATAGQLDPRTVYEIDRAHVRAAAVVVAYAGIPSFGVGIEVELAREHGIPVILVAERERPISRLLLGNPAVVEVVRFADLDGLRRSLGDALTRTAAAPRDGARPVVTDDLVVQRFIASLEHARELPVSEVAALLRVGELDGATASAIKEAVARGRLFGAGLRDLVGRYALRGPDLGAFVLRDVLELSLAETARTLGVDARTAKRHLSAGRARAGLAEDAAQDAVAQWLVTELIAPPTRALQLHLFAGGRA
jgi:sigma-70-like protein